MVRLMRNYSTYTAIVASIISIWAWLGWDFPLVKRGEWMTARASDEKQITHKFEQLGSRVERLEVEVSRLSTSVLEGQELQIMAQLRDQTIPADFRLRLEQQLRRVRNEIDRRAETGFGAPP
jgi:hypothetical protein